MPRRHANASKVQRGTGSTVRSEFLEWLEHNPTPTSLRRLEQVSPVRKRRRERGR